MSPFRIFAMAVCTADSCQVNSLIATKHPKNHDDHDKNAALAKVTIQKAFKVQSNCQKLPQRTATTWCQATECIPISRTI